MAAIVVPETVPASRIRKRPLWCHCGRRARPYVGRRWSSVRRRELLGLVRSSSELPVASGFRNPRPSNARRRGARRSPDLRRPQTSRRRGAERWAELGSRRERSLCSRRVVRRRCPPSLLLAMTRTHESIRARNLAFRVCGSGLRDGFGGRVASRVRCESRSRAWIRGDGEPGGLKRGVPGPECFPDVDAVWMVRRGVFPVERARRTLVDLGPGSDGVDGVRG